METVSTCEHVPFSLFVPKNDMIEYVLTFFYLHTLQTYTFSVLISQARYEARPPEWRSPQRGNYTRPPIPL